jgi:hypothetical protein
MLGAFVIVAVNFILGGPHQENAPMHQHHIQARAIAQGFGEVLGCGPMVGKGDTLGAGMTGN